MQTERSKHILQKNNCIIIYPSCTFVFINAWVTRSRWGGCYRCRAIFVPSYKLWGLLLVESEVTSWKHFPSCGRKSTLYCVLVWEEDGLDMAGQHTFLRSIVEFLCRVTLLDLSCQQEACLCSGTIKFLFIIPMDLLSFIKITFEMVCILQ